MHWGTSIEVEWSEEGKIIELFNPFLKSFLSLQRTPKYIWWASHQRDHFKTGPRYENGAKLKSIAVSCNPYDYGPNPTPWWGTIFLPPFIRCAVGANARRGSWHAARRCCTRTAWRGAVHAPDAAVEKLRSGKVGGAHVRRRWGTEVASKRRKTGTNV